MVFEHLAAFFVDKFLGNYIEDFDSHQLKINLWNGDITLENVHLKTNALNDLNVPIEIITGYLEKLKIHIPWKHLYAQTTKIELDGFYLLVAPKTDVNSDPSKKEEEDYQSKMKEVNKVEKFREQRERYEMNKNVPHHKDTFFERLQFHILRNLEIEIKNIHIAFDDKTTKSYPFQFGLTLNYIKLNTTNNEWEDIQPKEDSKLIYKFGEINNLSIYWNSNINSRLDLNKEDIIEDLKSNKHLKYSKMNYILQPINAKTKLKIAKTAQEQDFEQPVLHAEIDFEEISINLNRNQYSDILDLLEFEDYLNMKSKYIKYHSNIDQKQTSKRWKFAYEAIVNEVVRPRLASFKWENIKQNLSRYKEYHHNYLQELNQQLNKKQKQHLIELEKQIDVFNLIFIRRTAQIEYKKKKIEEKHFSWWEKLHSWWNSDSEDENTEFRLNDSLSMEEKNKFYDAIGYKDEQSSDNLFYPPQYIDIDLSMKLNLIELNVWSTINQNDSHLKVICRASIPNTQLQFQRRPAKHDFSFLVDIDSFEMCGIDSELNSSDKLTLSRPILIEPFNKSELNSTKLLHIEFETNPIDSKSDYRIHALSQSLQINYHSMTVNQLIQCFLPDKHHDLEGIKEAAYSIYTDIKNQTQFLVSENLKKIKDLDINIHLQSIYFLLPEYGYLKDSSSLICLDFGSLRFKGGQTNFENLEEDIFHDAKNNLDNPDEPSVVPLQIQLENFQLLYLNQRENWLDLRLKEDSPSHLIKPITLTINIQKSIIIDNPQIPIWTVNGEISSVECRLSDTRLVGFLKLIETIPYPESTQIDQNKESLKKDKKVHSSTKETYESIEKLTPVKKVLYEQQKDEQRLIESNSQGQIIQLKAFLQIPKIEILFERALLDLSDYTEEFLRILFLRINLSTQIETFDVQFNGYLEDLQIIHEQFLTNNKQKLNILSKRTNSNFVTMNCLLTSNSNPNFSSSPYNSIENNIHLQLNQILLNIQLEPLTSIILFKNNITNKLNKKQIQSNTSQPKQKSSSSSSSSPSFKIDFRLEEISILIGNNSFEILYIELKSLNGYFAKTSIQMLSHLILNDFRVIDLYPKSLYKFILSKENQLNDLITLDLSLSNSSNKMKKDSFIKGQLQKLNFIFLYKYLDLILSLINSFQTKQKQNPKQTNVSSTDQSFISSILQIPLNLNIILNAPTIIIPFNSYSKQIIQIDLGKLTMHTDSSSIEQHTIKFENLSASRLLLNDSNQMNLLESSPFVTSIKRNLNSEENDQISISMQWDTIDFKLTKYDYASFMKIFHENFKEKIFYKFPQIENNDQQDENESSTKISKQQSRKDQISPKIQLDFQIKQIALTLYLDETNLQSSIDQNSKFIYLTIQNIQASFQQLPDSTYNAKLQIEHLFADDLRQNNHHNNFERLINKGFNVDQNTSLIYLTLNYKTSIRTVNGTMESFYVLISPDLISSMKDFISYNIPLSDETKSNQSIETSTIKNDLKLNLPSPAKSISLYKPTEHRKSSSQIETNDQRRSSQRPSSSDDDGVETDVKFDIKPSQFVLIQDKDNNDSNCLVLNFAPSIRLVNTGDDTKISSSIKEFSFYGSTFEQLKDSKVKYSVFKPSNIDAIILMNSFEQKIDLNIGDLSISIDAAIIKTFVTLSKSLTKQQEKEQQDKESNPKEEKDKINSKTIFIPKPFKDSSFWFIENSEEKEELIEETDLLEMTTGQPSQKKNEIEQKNKEKLIEKSRNISQQLIINLKVAEIKIELGDGSSTRPVVAICLSDIFADIQNWSTDILITSSIQVELALFNDHLLAWEPLIEPIIDERGDVQSPWTIYCETIQDQQDENDEEYRYLLNDEKAKSEEKGKEGGINVDIKKLILIRAEYLLNLTLTKSTLDLGQRLVKMFNEAYEKGSTSDSDQQQSMLSIHNQTGFQIVIKDIIGIEFPKDNKSKEKFLNLKSDESIDLTIPEERLSATHLPTITEQVAKRKQQFQVQIKDKDLTVDINQTWRRIYEIASSSNPSWPIQLLCDSQIYKERRRIILSSIIKVSNRTQMPLILFDSDSIETKQFHIIKKINVDEEYYLPIHLLYSRTTSRIYFSLQQDESNVEINDFISFDWVNESISDRILKLNNGKEGHYVIYKEEVESYSENTDEPIRKSFNIFVKFCVHLINLLPIPIECLIDNIENVSLKPSELYHSTQGNKKSILKFTIPSYNNSKWISEPIDLSVKGYGIHNEHLLKFQDEISEETLRMVLRIDTYRGSYRLSFYSPFWILNSTDLRFQLKIDNEKSFIDIIDQPYFICPKKYHSDEHKKKGHIRLFSIEEDENLSQWSEGFSLDVIKSTGMTSCKVSNDRNYMICIDIVTSSFGMTKIVTLAPSTAIINRSSMDIQICETESSREEEQNNWILVKSNEMKAFWPKYLKEGVLYVRYFGNNLSSNCFSIKEKHRTLLRMNDDQCPAIHVEVNATDYDGYKVIFHDYQIGDAPLLIVNTLTNQNISFCQKDDLRTQVLPCQYFVYYTWFDTFKPRELIVSSNGNTTTIQLNPVCGILDKESEDRIYYSIFLDGPQTVLLFSSETSIIESVSDMPSLSESMTDYIQLGIRSIGISIINDINCEDLLYISINPSKELWTETRKYSIKPIEEKLNQDLEQHYKTYLKENSNNQQTQNKYQIEKNRYVSFDGEIAEISDSEGNMVHVKRDTFDGLWIGYTYSLSNMSIHLKINNLQIDNQLQITLFPTILYPIVSKAAATDIPGKPFIELSVFKSQSVRSNTIHIKYLKLLIQEFVFCADQGLILSILSFVKDDKNPGAPSVNMDADLKRISNPLETFIKGEDNSKAKETKIYFDDLHLSPLKIHVSFSMHGAKASEQLLAEYPLADFLLQILNVAEVQDVILKLNYYERKNDRYTITKLTNEISDHYENQFLKQIHVVVLGLDVLGNPFGVARGVAEGVESFFYEPYKGAMEGPIEFLEGIATGTKYLVGSVVGGAAGAISKVTGATSKGLATLTLDKNYQNARIQRKEIQSQTTPEIVSSGKNAMKDIMLGIKGVVKKPVEGGKRGGTKGFVKGLGKGFLGLVGRPASGVADLTSTSFQLIKRIATHEEIIHRVRSPRHVGRDGLVRPSIPHETLGNYLFNRIDDEKHTETEGYIAHIHSSEDPPTLFFATTKRIIFLIIKDSSKMNYEIEWNYNYKEIKGLPVVKFEPNGIEFTLKETNAIGMTKKDSLHVRVVPYVNVGEARYIVDKIIETTNALEK